MVNNDIEIIEKINCYDGFFKLVRYRLKHTLFDGGWSGELFREVLERGHAAAVLPYDPVNEQVVMIEQFRPGAIGHSHGAWLWEIVAGILESGEAPSEVVYREAVEETGCPVSDVIPICDFFVSPGSTSETTALFCGRVDASQANGIHGVVSENEDIKVHVVSLDNALDMLQTGKIRFAPAIIALQWLALHRDEVKTRWGIKENEL
ncbi:NUDIX domain-containing protein [Candidatus Parabeggiatoa sp. HSG14]|uniref:NUDIX domain-containing protein n=1 Tax=Candidatus Parabeggiatoa sp. HSG14 TaxID=3055593 RepID=UPI0025A81E8E|nr:NUDIX domain-containing protein [Thiotrichales bacterium HSG14]